MFYKLGINPNSKKWAKYENISSSLWVDNIEITSTKHRTHKGKRQ